MTTNRFIYRFGTQKGVCRKCAIFLREDLLANGRVPGLPIREHPLSRWLFLNKVDSSPSNSGP